MVKHYKDIFDFQIFIDENLKKYPYIQNIIKNYPDKITKINHAQKNYLKEKQHFSIIPKKGTLLGICASLSEEYICCGVHVLRSISNCPFNCTYCFLQNYLTNAKSYVIGDYQKIIDEVKEHISYQPKKFFRIGTWELGDSLAIEPIINQASFLIKEFANIPQACLELKTKSDQVDSILNLDHKGKTIISWTINPPEVIEAEELQTANFEHRLKAMLKCVQHGYLVAIHFDPMILHKNWEKNYQKIVKEIFSIIPSDKVAWISIGSLRFNPEMKAIIQQNYPKSTITSKEMILGPDRKVRYVKPLRIKMYQHLVSCLKQNGANDIFTYLCMERKDMWEKVFNYSPKDNQENAYNFTLSLYKRFPHLVPSKPLLKDYQVNDE